MPLGNSASDHVSSIKYAPGLLDSGDGAFLADKTITATAEPSVDDDSYSVTLTIPTDPHLEILNLACALSVTVETVDSVPQWLGGAEHLYVRAYVDTVNSDHLLFDLDIPSSQGTTPFVDVEAINATSHATIFGLLKNGQAHTLKFRCWVDAGSVMTQQGRVVLGVGPANYGRTPSMSIAHTGWVLLKGDVSMYPDFTAAWHMFAVADAPTLDSLDLQFQSEQMSADYILSIVGTNHLPGLLSPSKLYLCHQISHSSGHFAYLDSLGVLMWGVS